MSVSDLPARNAIEGAVLDTLGCWVTTEPRMCMDILRGIADAIASGENDAYNAQATAEITGGIVAVAVESYDENRPDETTANTISAFRRLADSIDREWGKERDAQKWGQPETLSTRNEVTK